MSRNVVAALSVAFFACSVPVVGHDGGRTDGSADGSTTLCARDLDCEDGLYCTVDRCRPGPTADARGCLVEAGPCGVGEGCDESTDRCEPVDCTIPDRDGDGVASMPCGGSDCDDDDGDRFPGNPEVCDPEGHDEDCRDDTFAGVAQGDADGDGFITNACCNGDRCGGDCDDSVAAVNPSASEICNGIDDDCSGIIDDETGPVPLCPGGVCLSGRCSFTSWDRVFGHGGNDRADGVATDSAGNVYVTGFFTEGTDFGRGPVDHPLVASYSPDGALRWVLSYEAASPAATVSAIAYGSADGALYLWGQFYGELTLGSHELSGAGGGFLARLDTDGSVAWVVLLPPLDGSVSAGAGRVVVAGSFGGSFDFGDGTARAASGARDAYLAMFTSGGELTWVHTYGAAGAHTTFVDVALDSTGASYAVGGYSGSAVDFGVPPRAAPGGAVVVLSLDSAGAYRWAQTFDSAASDQAVDVGGDLLFVAGRLGGSVDLGGGTAVGPGGFVLALTLDGAHGWQRVFNGAIPADVFGYDDDRVWVVGSFNGTVDFGNGGLVSHSDMQPDAFIALYAADGLHLRDRSFGGEANQSARAVTVGPGGALTLAGSFDRTITFDSGTRMSTLGQSGFVARVLY